MVEGAGAAMDARERSELGNRVVFAQSSLLCGNAGDVTV
jgi:hypothetical protein